MEIDTFMKIDMKIISEILIEITTTNYVSGGVGIKNRTKQRMPKYISKCVLTVNFALIMTQFLLNFKRR